MMGLLSWLLFFAGVPLVTAALVMFVEITAAMLTKGSARHVASDSERLPIAVLVPAHDESHGILPTLKDIRDQLRQDDRLLVVADNCNDDTAEIAEAAGAEVVKRNDPERFGKGYALDFGLRTLRDYDPEIVLVIDADCRLDKGAINQLALTCSSTGRPVQALYLMSAPEETKLNHQIAVFAWRIKNDLRPRGLVSLGLPCQLMGTGMAFPRSILRSADLATGHLAEDLHLGLQLASTGRAPFFCPSAVVRSEFPMSAEGAAAQRQRWEQGHLQVLLTEILPYIWTAVRKGNWRLLALSLDAAVPPITLLGLLIAGLLLTSCVTGLLGGRIEPLIVSSAALVLFVGGLALAWARCGSDVLPARTLNSIGPYIASKLVVYARMLASKGTPKWVRTDRNKPD